MHFKNYENLIEVALKTFCTFGNTCEKSFSIMNINKNVQHSCLTDNHLNDILKTDTSSISPEYYKLVDDKRYIVSQLIFV